MDLFEAAFIDLWKALNEKKSDTYWSVGLPLIFMDFNDIREMLTYL